MVLTTEVSYKESHVMTAKLSPSADEDCEMQLKALEKRLLSSSGVLLIRLTTVSKDRNGLSHILHVFVDYLMALLPSCFRYCLKSWRRNTANRCALAMLLKVAI